MAAISIKHISSRDNALVKSIANLAKSPSARRANGLCLLEGEHLAQSYVARTGELDSLVLRDDTGDEQTLATRYAALVARARVSYALPAKVFDSLSALSTPSGVLAIAKLPVDAPIANTGFVLAIDHVQDPGNVGTLIRSAAAAGCAQVWLSEGSAFAWSTKTLRAAQGAHFHVAVIESVDLSRALEAFNGERWATLPRALAGMSSDLVMASLGNTRFAANCALIVSNEGAGLSKTLYPAITHGLNIPMAAGIESLNVAVAGSIALFAVNLSRLRP